jgi:3-oxoacyl-[acyl-carrier protein] reductase
VNEETNGRETRIALVTRGSRGIGRAIVHALIEDGYFTVFSYTRDGEAAREVVDQSSGRAMAVQADVAIRADVQRLIDACHEQSGRLDLVVNNAGIFDESPIAEMSDEQWERTISVNLTGVFLVTRAAIPQLRADGPGGCIVNMVSQAGKRGSARHAHYAASKGGVLAFTRSAARELAPGIRVNAVSPGRVDTDLLEPFKARDAKRWLEDIPMARLGSAAEVAAAVVFLASADYITGETLEVNGGMLMD